MYVSNTRETKEDVGLLLNVAGDVKAWEKAEVVDVLFWSLLARSAFRPLCIVAEFEGRGGTCIKESKIMSVNAAHTSPWGWTGCIRGCWEADTV